MLCNYMLFSELRVLLSLLSSSINDAMLAISRKCLKNFRMSATMHATAILAVLQCSLLTFRILSIDCDSLLYPRLHAVLSVAQCL